MKTQRLFIFTALLFLFAGCKTIEMQSTSVDANNPQDHLGTMHIPESKKEDFQKAAILVIQIVNSPQFEQEVQKYSTQLAKGGEYSQAWAGWNTANIVAGIRSKIQGLEVNTDGGPVALWNHIFSGTIAKDGGTTGPIRMNWFALGNRTVADLCNTIAHETAHRAGMTHPHSNVHGKFNIALCEPPYVIVL